jgi:HoxN/HupN/NixA family high-affinity nickel-transporter
VILFGLVKVFREMRAGRYDEAGLERRLDSRGLMNRLFGRLTKAVAKPRHMYPIGLLFGLGFDTASEVALLVIAGGAGAAGLPWHAILCLPILFAAGMSLMDTLDGSLMTRSGGQGAARFRLCDQGPTGVSAGASARAVAQGVRRPASTGRKHGHRTHRRLGRG